VAFFRRYKLVFGLLFGFALWAVPAIYYQNCTAYSQTDQTTEPGGPAKKPDREPFWVRTADDPTAFFTAVVALFTLVLAVSTIGLWIVTWLASRRQAREIRQIERPFVFIEGFTYELTTAADFDTPADREYLPKRYKDQPELYVSRFAVLPRWKNGGRTATEDMRIQVNWRGPPGTIPPEYTYRNPAVRFFLGPQDVQHSDVVEIPSAMVLVEYAMNPVGVEPLIFIWGRADYKDAFGEPHFLEWCYKLRLERHQKGQRVAAHFIQWGEHNRSS
jgi:hypothetical protein